MEGHVGVVLLPESVHLRGLKLQWQLLKENLILVLGSKFFMVSLMVVVTKELW
jgi:hypothetical protein